MLGRLRTMLVKEFIQVFRDPRMRTVIFVIPCLQTIVIGYAVTTDVRNVPTAVFDKDQSVDSRELVARFADSGCFRVVAAPTTEAEVRSLVDRGVASVVLHIQHGFSEDLRARRTALLQVIVDGTDSNTAGIVMSYITRIALGYSDQVLVERFRALGAAAQPPGRITLRTRAWYNENLESRYYFVPAVIMVVVTLVTLLLTSMAVVREKEIGTMEQIMVSPIAPGEFILGKTAPFALVGFADMLIVTAVGAFWFEVPVRGSLVLLTLATGVYLLTTLGIGLYISTVSDTQQQAMMGTFFFFFPAMLLSGFAFPIDNMPRVVQWLTYVNPMRYFLEIVRALFLKGVGLDVLWPQYAALTVMGLVVMRLAVARLRKTM
jgi:ABC-2 type transport system permease protein